jgi:hypothetical protein
MLCYTTNTRFLLNILYVTFINSIGPSSGVLMELIGHTDVTRLNVTAKLPLIQCWVLGLINLKMWFRWAIVCVCLWVCVSVCVCVCVRMYMYIYLCVYMCVRARMCIDIHICSKGWGCVVCASRYTINCVNMTIINLFLTISIAFQVHSYHWE